MGLEAKLILDHINTKLRTVGHNNITRCQSGAEGGHDRSGANLSISIEDPAGTYAGPDARKS
jgi:hypothetical protein